MFIYPDRADNPYFSPLPIFGWKTEFLAVTFNRIPPNTSRPYLRSECRHSERLLILHEVGLLLITEEQNLIAMYETQERAKRITDIHILWGQSTVIEELIQAGKINEEYLYPFNGDEVLEWWLVTPWLAERLREQGEIVIDKLGCRWWGRLTSGQAIYMDGVIQEICGND